MPDSSSARPALPTDGPARESLQPSAAFDELARLSLAEHSLESVMQTVAELTRRTLPGADEVSVTFLEAGVPRTVASTGELATRLDERQYERGAGPCLHGVEANQVVLVDRTSTEDRWPEWAAAAREAGAGSSLTVPVPVQRELTAALNVYSTDEHVFGAAAQELAATFAAYAGVALANVHRYEAKGRLAQQLREAMASRAVVEQAKGILMGQRRCTAEEAFGLLATQSQTTGRTLRDVAEALVEQTSRPG